MSVPICLIRVHIDVSPALINNVLDTGWLMSHLFSELEVEKSSGSGLLPKDWLIPSELMTKAIKKALKEADEFIYSYGHIQGYYPLRELFTKKLDDIGIKTVPDLIITTQGASSAIQIVLNTLTSKNDYVIIDDPSWFWLIGCLQQHNLNILTVPRDENGPNIDIFETLLQQYKPKLYITNSTLNNPTSFNLSPQRIYKILNLLHQYECYLLEDDVYSELNENKNTLRYASLDQFERVFYTTGVSKILGANWRVGFLCVPQAFLETILRQKMLSNMTSPELTERSIYYIWLNPQYQKHINHIRTKLIKENEKIRRLLKQNGFDYSPAINYGIFIWLDTGLDTTQMAIDANKEGYLLAPGYLFSPHPNFSTYLRLNITRTSEAFIHWLGKYKQKMTNKSAV